MSAQTFTTLKSGSWSNSSDVWSKDGLTPCYCSPGTVTKGADIVINHDLTIDDILDVTQKSDIYVNEAVVSGSYKITIWSGTLTVDSAIVHLSSGGEFEVKQNGNIFLVNSGKLVVSDNEDDDITNDGNVDICSTCCVSISNSFDNSGIVSGSGSVISDDEIDNKGSWSNLIAWCAVRANGLTMSSADCQTAEHICGQLALPVELSEFKGTLMHDYVRLEWVTVSEIDNDYFKVMRSEDGEKWFEIGHIKGMGNSTVKNCYSYEDIDLHFSLAYYKLIQVDFSGREFHSPSITVRNEASLDEVILFPNPMMQTNELTIGKLEPGEGTLYIVDTQGQVLLEQEFDGSSGEVKVNTSSVQSNSYYLVNLKQCGQSRTLKLVVLE